MGIFIEREIDRGTESERRETDTTYRDEDTKGTFYLSLLRSVYIFILMPVSVYACIYVCMYVCIYICTYLMRAYVASGQSLKGKIQINITLLLSLV